jgi:electron transfer flavoprotein beta subunit
MKILVCITHVPDTTSKIAFTENNTKFDATGVQFIIGPYDDYALARAVEIRDLNKGEITVLNVGLVESEPSLRKALAIGADKAIRINQEPQDSYQVAELIAEYARDKSFDLILTGRESIDYNGGLVHGLVGEMLYIPSVSPVMKLEIEGVKATLDKEIEGGKQTIEIDLPFVAGCQEPIAEWKIPNMRGIMGARSKPLEVIEPNECESKSEINSFELPLAKAGCKIISSDNLTELVDLLKKESELL